MKKIYIFDAILAITFMFSVYQLYHIWEAYYGGYDYIWAVSHSHEFRPFVYRMLVPLLSRILEYSTGIKSENWLTPLVLVSSIGLYFALKELFIYHGKEEKVASIFSFLSCEAFLFTLIAYPKVYDIPTALGFTLALLLIQKGNHTGYLILFPIMTLNRETTFLMTLFWMVISIGRMSNWKFVFLTMYQVVVYIAIRFILMATFAYLPGELAQWNLRDNFLSYIEYPLLTAFLLIYFTILFHVVLKGMSTETAFITIAFFVIFPIQLVLYFTLGMSWELRVFAESVPTISVLFFSGIENIYRDKIPNRWKFFRMNARENVISD